MSDESPGAEAPQPPTPDADIGVVKFGELPFGWTDGGWETFVVELPDGQTATLLVLTFPNGQVGMYFSPEAMHALARKAERTASRAKLHVQGEAVLDAIVAAKNGHRG